MSPEQVKGVAARCALRLVFLRRDSGRDDRAGGIRSASRRRGRRSPRCSANRPISAATSLSGLTAVCGVCWPRTPRIATRRPQMCAPIWPAWPRRRRQPARRRQATAWRRVPAVWKRLAWGALGDLVVGAGAGIWSSRPDSLRPVPPVPGAATAHSIDCRASTRQLLGRSQPGLLR